MGFSHVTNSDPTQPSGAFAAAMNQYDAQIFDVVAKEELSQRLQSMLEAGQQGDTATVVAMLQQLKAAASYAGNNSNVSMKDLFGEGGLGGLLTGQPPQALDSVAAMMKAPHLLGPKDSATTVSLWSLLENPNKQMSVDIAPAFRYALGNHKLMPPSGDDSWNGPSFYSDGTDFGGPSVNSDVVFSHPIRRDIAEHGSAHYTDNLSSGFSIVSNIQSYQEYPVEKFSGSISLNGPASSFAAWIAGSSNFCSTLQQLLQ